MQRKRFSGRSPIADGCSSRECSVSASEPVAPWPRSSTIHSARRRMVFAQRAAYRLTLYGEVEQVPTSVGRPAAVRSAASVDSSIRLLRRSCQALGFGIRTRAVDVRHLRPQRAEIRGQLPAMMHAVVVGEANVSQRRHFHHTEEAQRRRQLFRRQGAQRLQLFRKRLPVTRDGTDIRICELRLAASRSISCR